MTPDFLTGATAQAIGWSLLHLVWQATVVAGILAAALSLLRNRSANARYLAACIALASLPLLAVITAVRSYEPPVAAADAPIALRAESLPIDIAKAAVVSATKATVFSAGDAARQALPWIVLAWLAGVTVLSIRLVVSWTRVQRLAAEAVPASVPWEATLEQISRQLRLRDAVKLLESAAIEVPTVIGWLRPAILLPASTLTGLSPEQIEMLLAHELAHIRRNDFLVNVMQSVVETLMFYHPAAWWISNRIRVERENCCDDLAVEVCGSPVRYARALTRLEELRAAQSGLVVAANGGSLIGRIRRLVGAPVDATTAAPRWFAGVGVLAVIAVVLAAPTLPLRADREEDSKKPAEASAKAEKADSRIEVTADAAPEADHESDHESGLDEQYAAAAAAADEGSDHDVDLDIEEDADGELPGTPVAPRVAMAIDRVMSTAPRALIAPGAPMAVVNPTPAIAPRVLSMAEAMSDPKIAEAVADAFAAEEKKSSRRSRAFGTTGKLTVEELIELRNAGVTPEYIEEMRKIGLGELTLGDIAEMRLHGVSPAYVREMRAAGLEIKSAREITELRIHGVNPSWIQSMRDSGYPNLTRRDLLDLRIHGVSSEWIKAMRDAGYTNLTARELVQLRSMGVTPAFIKALADAGYTNLTARELSKLAASGVSADFIRSISKYRDTKK